MNRLWIACLAVWLSIIATRAVAAADDYCAVCARRSGTKIFSIKKLGTEDKVLICAECAKLETECYLCGVPVKDKFTKLADGRLLCPEDAKRAVLEQDEAVKIFEDVKRDAQTILSRLGTLPHRNIQLILEAKPKLDKTGGNVISRHEDSLLMGLTRSRCDGGECQHTIYLLHGLTRERLAVVAAHEYGHAWLHENVSRKMNQDAVEGFCDWLSYQVIKNKPMANEMKVLLASDYSQGQLQAFIAAEKEHSFYRVMQWVKSGVEPAVDVQHLERILHLREPAASEPEPAFAFATAAPPRSDQSCAQGIVRHEDAPLRADQRPNLRAARARQSAARGKQRRSHLPRNPRRRGGGASGRRERRTHAEAGHDAVKRDLAWWQWSRCDRFFSGAGVPPA